MKRLGNYLKILVDNGADHEIFKKQENISNNLDLSDSTTNSRKLPKITRNPYTSKVSKINPIKLILFIQRKFREYLTKIKSKKKKICMPVFTKKSVKFSEKKIILNLTKIQKKFKNYLKNKFYIIRTRKTDIKPIGVSIFTKKIYYMTS